MGDSWEIIQSQIDLKNGTEKLRENIVHDVNNRIEEFKLKLRSPANSPKQEREKKPTKTRGSHGKQFKVRESLFTVLFQAENITSIYNFFLAGLLLCMANTFVHDYFEQGRVNLDFPVITWCFGKLPIVITIWMCMFLSTLLIVYPAFYTWANLRKPSGALESFCWILLYIVYICLMIYFPPVVTLAFDLPIASSFIVTCEQTRLLMKSHSFIRENAPRAQRYKRALVKKDDDEIDGDIPTRACPQFEKYLYFLFAPTIIYRDSYPRTTVINWWKVAGYFIQCIGCIFYTNYTFVRFCMPLFHDFSAAHMQPGRLVVLTFSSILPGMMCLLMIFWGLLHAWHNAFAEMLRFGDRLFYTDWWNSTSFAGYYRAWNIPVHDWLHAYVYRDLTIILPGARTLGAVAVFFLSSLVHEYIMSICFRCFYPLLFTLFFIFGAIFFFVTKGIAGSGWQWNVFMWWNLMFGNGLIIAMYSMEWFAHANCPPVFGDYRDILIPRQFTCAQSKYDLIH